MNLTALKDFFKRNRFLIFLSVLIIFLLAFNIFGFLYLQRIKKRQPPSLTPIVTLTPPLTFTSPVKSEHLQTIPEYAVDSDHLVFFLPDQAPIYALISGRVSHVGEKVTEEKVEFKNIIIVNETEDITVSYLLSAGSELLVEEGDSATEGMEIAKSSQETDPGCLGGANLGVYLFKDGQAVKLTKEMMETGKILL